MVVRTKGKITQIDKITPTVIHLKFQTEDEFIYESGQFVNIIIQKDEKPIRRAYSISSHPENNITNEFELCIKLVEDGQLTPILFKSQIGDEFNIMGPLGLFKLKRVDENVPQICIAAGTGVAPMRSFIKDLLQNKEYKEEIKLYLGIRYNTEILYIEEFEQLQEQYSNFTFIPIISRPDENWEGLKGYVQDHLQIDNSNSQFYICGLNKMVEAVEEKLLNEGVLKEHIKFEKFG